MNPSVRYLHALMSRQVEIEAIHHRFFPYGDGLRKIGFPWSRAIMMKSMAAMKIMMNEDHAHGRAYRTAIMVNRNGDVGNGFWGELENLGVNVAVEDRDTYLRAMQERVFEEFNFA